MAWVTSVNPSQQDGVIMRGIVLPDSLSSFKLQRLVITAACKHHRQAFCPTQPVRPASAARMLVAMGSILCCLQPPLGSSRRCSELAAGGSVDLQELGLLKAHISISQGYHHLRLLSAATCGTSLSSILTLPAPAAHAARPLASAQH